MYSKTKYLVHSQSEFLKIFAFGGRGHIPLPHPPPMAGKPASAPIPSENPGENTDSVQVVEYLLHVDRKVSIIATKAV